MLVLLAVVAGCEERPRERTPPVSLLPDARTLPKWGNCFAQSEFLGDPNTSSRQPRSYLVKGGDGAGAYCLGEPRTKFSGCADSNPCKSRSFWERVDLHFDSQDTVRAIRVNRRGRTGNREKRDPLWITDTFISLGKPTTWLPRDLPKPIRKEQKNDEEFGPIEIWYFPGLEVEIEYDKKGVQVVGALTVVKK